MGSMLITSSRKPSAKTKTLCKLLSRFFNASKCIVRGKMSVQDLAEVSQGETFIIIGEYHGNPGELNFYDEAGKILFSLRFSDSYSKELDSYWFPNVKPFLTGEGEITNAFESFFNFERVEQEKIDQLRGNSTLIAVGKEEIDFIGSGKSLFKFKIKGFKKY